MRQYTHPVLALLIAAVVLTSPALAAETPNADIYVRDGYELSIALSTVERPRFMEFGPDNTLYVSLPKVGEIKACRDTDGDGVYESVTTFVERHQTAHAMQWHDGALWFTETGAIFRAVDSNKDGKADDVEKIIGNDVLPEGGGHWWRSLLIHDGRIYTSIGDSGNITDQTDTKRQKIWSYDVNGGDEKLYCSGIRNNEKLVVRPGTDEIWGMDHGSDWYGRVIEKRVATGRKIERQPITDMVPPEEMNLYIEGGFYGHPFLIGNRIPRFEYMDREDMVDLAEKTIVPQWPGGPHWAANSMEFYTGDQFPETKGDAFVAYHGSWNRSVKAGYCVTRVLFDRGRPFGELIYAHFIDEDQNVFGRPVDTVMEPDGSLLISDDYGHKVYRLRYVGK